MVPDIAAAGGQAADGLERLVALDHPDPHSILGAHVEADGVAVRAFRPDAERITLLIEGEERGREMKRVHPAGVFEARVKGRRELFGYRLEIFFRAGDSITIRDPYCFLPTLGDLDLYLLGELKHERAYEALGAHHSCSETFGRVMPSWPAGVKEGLSANSCRHCSSPLVETIRGQSGVWLRSQVSWRLA